MWAVGGFGGVLGGGGWGGLIFVVLGVGLDLFRLGGVGWLGGWGGFLGCVLGGG